jgi:hypothetical protein
MSKHTRTPWYYHLNVSPTKALIVEWYENSGPSDPQDATTPWRICREALKKASSK